MALFLCISLLGYTLASAGTLSIEQVSNVQRKAINSCAENPALCPTADPYPGCEDSSKVNCTDVKHQVCSFASAYLICPRTCNLCDRNPSYHPCKDHVHGLNCADLPDPCNDSVGIISCPQFCGVCSSPTPPSTTLLENPQTNAPLTTTPLPVTVPSSDPCDIHHCMNGGSCFSNGFMLTCSCPGGYSGPSCNIEPSPSTTTAKPTPTSTPTAATQTTSNGMCALKPCLNGEICSNTNGGFVCLCLQGLVWSICSPDIQITTTKEKTSPAPPLTTVATASPTKMTSTKTPPQTTTPDPALCLMNMHELGCQAADVVFMVEYSNSDADGCSLSHQGDFIMRLVNRWSKSNPGIRVGVVTYHDTAEQPINITDYQDLHGLEQAINHLTGSCRHEPDHEPDHEHEHEHEHQEGGLHPSGTARLAHAFNFVRKNSFAGHIHNIPKVVIPIIHATMGLPWQHNVVPASQRLKDTCVSIMPVVVRTTTGNPTSPDGLRLAHQIASSPSGDFYQEFNSFVDLEHSDHAYGSNCH